MPPEIPSFAERAQLTEWMDEPSTYEEFRACLSDLERVNRLIFSYRPTLRWLAQFPPLTGSPLRIVDVGCGGGDMLRRIDAWARRKRIPVRLTGIDSNPFATRAAREFSGAGSRIEWLTCAAQAYQPEEKIDLIISSLFTHHLADAEIVPFLRWMERTASLGWFINDLRRARLSYYGFKLLANAMRWHRFVRHDGPVSIRRSFSPSDWRRYAQQAGLDAGGFDLSIFKAWPGRLCVARVK
jgi:SAM-dependent methyltransferase